MEKLLIALLGIQQPLRLFRRHFLSRHSLGLPSLAILLSVGLLACRFCLLLLFVILLARLILRLLILLLLLVLLRLLLRLILLGLLLLLLILLRLLVLLVLLILLVLLLLLLLALLFEQFIQLFQLDVIRISCQSGIHRLPRSGNVVGNIRLRAAVKKIISGRELRASSLP